MANNMDIANSPRGGFVRVCGRESGTLSPITLPRAGGKAVGAARMSQGGIQPGSVKTLALDKSKAFVGVQKKSRFQKEKEEREARQRKQEEETAKIYEQFVASFDADDDTTKTFVRGDTYVPKGASSGGGREESRSGGVYKLSRRGSSEMDRILEEMKAKDERQPAPLPERKKPSRQIDAFLEELKTKQVSGKPGYEESAPYKGSYDDGDPETTNLYVGNLAPTLTEESLTEHFRKFGEIYSVKIMWPRTEEERQRKRNCGFVSFYRRADAEDAKLHMHDAEVEGYRITIGWGKAIKRLTNLAINTIVQDTVPPEGPKELEPPPIVASAMKHKEAEAAKESRPERSGRKWDQPPAVLGEREMRDDDPKIEVVIPTDPEREFLITRTARYVAKDGSSLEQLIREKELDNPDFAFLFKHDSPEGIYYRWKAFSMAMGDREESWRTKPFQLNLGGPFWIPPPVPERPPEEEEERDRERSSRRERDRGRDRGEERRDSSSKDQYLTGRQLEKARDREKGRDSSRRLSDEDADEFENMLRHLNDSRQAIKEAMGFALDNSEASEEVVEMIKESLLVKETAIPIKIARLYLVSDVLHNSMAAVRNASTFRSFLEKCLPDVFEAFNDVLRAPALGRITAQNFEEKVMGVLRVWESWGIYPPLYLTGLEATFRRRTADLEALAIPADELAQLEERKIHVMREARIAGLSTQGTLLDVARRLKYLDGYAKLKAAGLATSSVLAARPDTKESLVAGGSSDDDDDIDGVPLPGPAPPSQSRRRERPAGKRPSKRIKGAQGAWSTVGEGGDEDESDDDDDVDGVPLDAMPPPPPQPQPQPQPQPRSRYDNSDSDSDVDGRPLDEDNSRGKQRDPALSDSDDDGGMKIDIFGGAEESSTGSGRESGPKWSESEEEERRTMLRTLETKLLLLRDDMEAKHVPPDEIEERISQKRNETVQTWEREVLAKREAARSVREAAAASLSDRSSGRKKKRSRSRSREKDSRERRRSRSRSPRRSSRRYD